jgi:hypothetical protein
MNKHINFEDNIFILNVRIRMIRDLLKLDPDPALFLDKTLDDLEFIGKTLETLLGSLIANPRLLDRNPQFENLSDAEWQFSQILARFAGDDSPFTESRLPELRNRIARLREASAIRGKAIDESAGPAEQFQTEPVVSQAELSELLKGI